MCRVTVALAVSSLLPVPALPAQSLPQRDPQALAVVAQGIQALGGMASVGQVADSTLTGTIQPTAGSPVAASTFIWKNSGDQFRYETQTASGTSVFVSGHGSPASIRAGTVKALFPHMALASQPFHLPALVLSSALTNAQLTVQTVGATAINGVPAIQVHISLDTDQVSSLVTPQDWYLDAASALPLRVEYRSPASEDPASYIRVAEDFSDFRSVSGLFVPFAIAASEDEVPVAAVGVTSVTFNTGLSPQVFDAPTGGSL